MFVTFVPEATYLYGTTPDRPGRPLSPCGPFSPSSPGKPTSPVEVILVLNSDFNIFFNTMIKSVNAVQQR